MHRVIGSWWSSVYYWWIQWINNNLECRMLWWNNRRMVWTFLMISVRTCISLVFFIRYDVADMNLYRSALSACVVNGLTITKQFLSSNEIFHTQTTSSRPTTTGQLSSTVHLTPITLASLNQSLRHFTHSRIHWLDYPSTCERIATDD